VKPLILILLFFIGPSSALGRPGESLEWLTSASEYVGIFRITEVTIQSDGYRIFFVNMTVHLESSLKGECPDSVMALGEPVERVPSPNERVLVFNGGYFINLDHPDTGYPAITIDFELLQSGDSILAVVKERLSYLKERGHESDDYPAAVLAWIPSGPTFSKVKYSMNSPFLAIPPTEKHLKESLEIAATQTGSARLEAVCVLMHCFPGIDVTALLKEMLTDPWNPSETDEVIFPAREVAYYSLLKMGIEVDIPEGYRNPYSMWRCDLVTFTGRPAN